MLLPLMASIALANGQTSHVWITVEAVPYVQDPDLAELVTRDDLRTALISGAMFPDGGYAVGDPYGEDAHWEPFQRAYLAWIQDTYGGPPWTDEGAMHVAFLLGMASHGMADQTYDAMYMERAHVYDEDAPWSTESMDTATDVALAALVHPEAIDTAWVPSSVLSTIFQDARGIDVDADTLDGAQDLLQVAIWFVTSAAEVPETVDMYAEQWPWACAEQLNDDVPGSPPNEARVVAAYWDRVYLRLLGEEPDDPVIATFPREGGWSHPTDADSIESMVTLVFARGIEDDSVDAALFTAVSDQGDAVPLSVDLFYGQSSHVVNLRPEVPWLDDTSYTITVAPGLRFIDGTSMNEPFQTELSTATPPLPDPAPAAPPSSGCTSGAAGSSSLVALAAALLVSTRRRP